MFSLFSFLLFFFLVTYRLLTAFLLLFLHLNRIIHLNLKWCKYLYIFNYFSSAHTVFI